MNANDQLPAGADIDRLLATFFKSELPDPFPEMKLPAARAAELPMPAAPRPAAAERRPVLTKSRFSLAVSVALLLGGCWYLSGHIGGAPANRPTPGKNGAGEAKPNKHLLPKDDTKPPMVP